MPSSSLRTTSEGSSEKDDEDDAALHNFTFRWVVDVENWNPIDEHEGREFQFLLDLIAPEDERAQVLKYLHFADKKRALVSRLLTRAACTKASKFPFKEVRIKRTKGKKPFFANVHERVDSVKDKGTGCGVKVYEKNEFSAGIPKAPNFNFNVSHEGKYVALVSEPYAICGVDVAAPDQLRLGNRSVSAIEEIFGTFGNMLHASEKEQILKQNGPSSQLSRFRQLWSLKEAWSKCMGTGLGANFGQAAFSISQSSMTSTNGQRGDDVIGETNTKNKATENNNHSVWTATISAEGVDNENNKNWSFHLHPFPPLADVYDSPEDNTHWITVARGPTNSMVDANGEFWKTLKAKNIESKRPDVWRRNIWRHAPTFRVLEVKDLVPSELRYRYTCIVREDNCEKGIKALFQQNSE